MSSVVSADATIRMSTVATTDRLGSAPAIVLWPSPPSKPPPSPGELAGRGVEGGEGRILASTPNQRGRRGRTTHNINATNASTQPRQKAVEARLVARPMATTNARMAHAVASSTAAQVIAMLPRKVLAMPRSLRIRASTGNAVMLRAIPMNKANAGKEAPGAAYGV